MGGWRGDALEGPLPFVAERVDDEAILRCKAPWGGANDGGCRTDELAPDADEDDSKAGPDRMDE